MDSATITLSIIGAFAGTYGGAFLINLKQAKKIKTLRKIAIKGLVLIRNYGKGQNIYSIAQNDFNNTLNVAEKRAVLVSLHKLGVPIEVPVENIFDIKNIQFSDKTINVDEIDGMIIQISNGHCDHLFFMDVDTYFTANTRIKALRNIGKRFVYEVLMKSRYELVNNILVYPEHWEDIFSYSEGKFLRVFMNEVGNTYYYYDTKTGEPKEDSLAQLLNEIEMGLWDGYFEWDYNAYQSVIHQKKIAETVSNQIAMQGQQSVDKH